MRNTRAVLAAAALLGGCGDDGMATDAGSDAGLPDSGPSDAGQDGGDGGTSSLTWTPCHVSYECATLEVPLDHDDPGGETIELSLLRSAASRPSQRIGALLFNPGGPGGSGILAALDAFPLIGLAAPVLEQRFDLIGFDPRGIGESTPVDCADDAALDAFRTTDADPTDDPGWAALDDTFQDFAAGCTRSPPGLLDHVSTEDVARDMDLIREALGEEQISYLGISYGTYLGAIYGTLFPDRVRAFVLDSAVTPRHQDQLARRQDEGTAYEATLEQFFADCAADATCAFHGGEPPAAVGAAFDALLATASGAGIPAGARRLSETDLRAAVAGHLRDAAYTELADRLAAAEGGDASMLLGAADAFFGRFMDGTYVNAFEALIAVSALDFPCPAGFDLAAARTASSDLAGSAGSRIAPFFLGVTFGTCLHWPVSSAEPPFAIDAADAPPMLIVQSMTDTATPLPNASELRTALNNGSHLLVYGGAGHGTIGRSSCAREAAVAFVLDPTITPPSTCPTE